MDPVLKVTDLSKYFSRAGKNGFFAVDHVSFAVMPGEILGIVGESGSGKSTIAKLITRQIDATAGTIEIEGQDITGLKGRDMIPVYAKIQMVFQMPKGSFDPAGPWAMESVRVCGTRGSQRRSVRQRRGVCWNNADYPAIFWNGIPTRYPADSASALQLPGP